MWQIDALTKGLCVFKGYERLKMNVGCGEAVMKYLWTAFFLIMISAACSGGTRVWIPVCTDSFEQSPEVVRTKTRLGWDITIKFRGFFLTPVQNCGCDFQKMDVPGCGEWGEVGGPSLPFFRVSVPIPLGVDILFHTQTVEPKRLVMDAPAYPYQPPVAENHPQRPELFYNQAYYQTVESIPRQMVQRVGDIVVHGKRTLELNIFPLQYQPADHSLHIFPEITVLIECSGTSSTSPIGRTPPRSCTVAPSSFLLRDDCLTPLTYSGNTEYLIIAPSSMLNTLRSLALWKRRKGYVVKLVGTDTTGTTAKSIRDYIQKEYNTSTDFAYVLLVGDQNAIPPFEVNSKTSDLPYSLLEGNDIYPDVALGRLSVSDTQELSVIVDKILEYEMWGLPEIWCQNATIAGYFQDSDNNDCFEDRWFLETAMRAFRFLKDTKPYTMVSAFTASDVCNPYHYNRSGYPHRMSLPADGLYSPPDAALISPSGDATMNIIRSLRQGVGMMLHRGHGVASGWVHPSFDVWFVGAISNERKTPVVYSMNCLTGQFDSMTDCLAECFLKNPYGGAVGVVAATEESYTGPNDLLTQGIMDCVWDDFDTNDGGNVYAHSIRPAEMLMYAKYYLAKWYGASDSFTETMFHIFEYHGDPEMRMRLGVQMVPIVSYPAWLKSGTPSMIVNCSEDGAWVAVTQEGILVGKGKVATGQANVVFTGVPVPGVMDVVVSGTNVVCFQGNCSMNSPDDVPGDVNGDHTVNHQDVVELSQLLIGNVAHNQKDFHLADMDANGSTDICDLYRLASMVRNDGKSGDTSPPEWAH